MKARKILKTILIMEYLVLAIIVVWILYQVINAKHATLLFQETSSDGEYTLCIERLGHPTPILLPLDRIRIRFCENWGAGDGYNASFQVDVPTKGTAADYQVEWIDGGVKIVLLGKEPHYYILPFMSTKN